LIPTSMIVIYGDKCSTSLCSPKKIQITRDSFMQCLLFSARALQTVGGKMHHIVSLLRSQISLNNRQNLDILMLA
jgi:hypothetical protein